jgi:hypothetical protein
MVRCVFLADVVSIFPVLVLIAKTFRAGSIVRRTEPDFRAAVHAPTFLASARVAFAMEVVVTVSTMRNAP